MDFSQSIKHCPKCGEHCNYSDRRIDCPNCNFVLYLAPAVCNSIILFNEKDELMLCKRALDPFKGYLDLPGGFVEFGEDLEESVVRETREEMGVEIDRSGLNYIGSYTDKYIFRGVEYSTLCIVFSAKIESDMKFQPTDDAEDLIFFPFDKIPYDKLAFTSVGQTIKDFLKISKQ